MALPKTKQNNKKKVSENKNMITTARDKISHLIIKFMPMSYAFVKHGHKQIKSTTKD